ncbi:MAG: HPr family phosphocarrier protein [Elusimicrobiota bacterium]|jgi:phosphocarrier protein|nr:HPr family phosphocarrier protein [Elusimicrobiota bacterium]
MEERILTIKLKKGLHSRPASEMVRHLSKYQSKVKIIKDDFEIDAKSIMGILTLAAAFGTVLKFVIEGEDEVKTACDLEVFFEKTLREYE